MKTRYCITLRSVDGHGNMVFIAVWEGSHFSREKAVADFYLQYYDYLPQHAKEDMSCLEAWPYLLN